MKLFYPNSYSFIRDDKPVIKNIERNILIPNYIKRYFYNGKLIQPFFFSSCFINILSVISDLIKLQKLYNKKSSTKEWCAKTKK